MHAWQALYLLTKLHPLTPKLPIPCACLRRYGVQKLSLSPQLPSLVWRQSPSQWTWSSLFQLGWLSRGFSCLCLPSTGLQTCTATHFLCGCWGARVRLALMFLKQALYQSVLKHFLTCKVAVETWGSDGLCPEYEGWKPDTYDQ